MWYAEMARATGMRSITRILADGTAHITVVGLAESKYAGVFSNLAPGVDRRSGQPLAVGKGACGRFEFMTSQHALLPSAQLVAVQRPSLPEEASVAQPQRTT